MSNAKKRLGRVPKKGLAIAASAIMVALAMTAPANAERQTAKVGVLAYMGVEHGHAEWAPTIEFLRWALPDLDFVAIPLDLPATRRAVGSGAIDFLITNPGNYVELEAAFGISRIATLETRQKVGSAIIVRTDRQDIGSLEDVRGKRVAAVAPGAFGGYQVAWRVLAANGIAVPEDLAAVEFTGFPMDRVLTAIAEGRADVGVVKACLIEQMAERGAIQRSQFRILGARIEPDYDCALSSPLYPDWPFAQLRGTDKKLAKRVATALLAYEPGEGRPQWTVPLDYQPVHELFRELHIGPYEIMRRKNLVEVLLDNWHWLAVLGVGMGWWVIHVLRVKHLVQERTAALRQANRNLAREMADRQCAEQSERQHRMELEHVARLSILGEMASNIAHELNQPLAAIVNYADGCANMLRQKRIDPHGFHEAVQRISDQARRASLTIQRVRDFVRKRSPVRMLIDINQPLQDAADLFEGAACRTDVILDLRLAAGLPPIEADPIQLQQVFLNLMQNAVDAMEGRQKRRRRIIMCSGADGDGVEVTVCDEGPGFTPEARQRLFEPYYTSKAAGIGLGMAISRSIIESHGGQITVDDASGGGACVRIRLPATLAAAPSPPLETAGPEPFTRW